MLRKGASAFRIFVWELKEGAKHTPRFFSLLSATEPVDVYNRIPNKPFGTEPASRTAAPAAIGPAVLTTKAFRAFHKNSQLARILPLTVESQKLSSAPNQFCTPERPACRIPLSDGRFGHIWIGASLVKWGLCRTS